MIREKAKALRGRIRARNGHFPEAQASALRQTRHEHAMETAEDYAEAIADLISAHGEARAVDLARRFGVTHVTVVRTVARLQKEGYLSTQPYRAIFLTTKGSQLAAESRKRHDIVLEFLKNLGVPAEIAHSDAEGIEHHVSPETLAAFKRFSASRSASASPMQSVRGKLKHRTDAKRIKPKF